MSLITSLQTSAGLALNFMVIGEHRSGAAVLQNTINQADRAVCHLNLLHPNKDVRRAEHEAYFGPCLVPHKNPEWFMPTLMSPWQYVEDVVFDNAREGEQAIGMRLPYDELARYELYDLLEKRYRDGDFCVVHVYRNPVACLVSLRQAERSRCWKLDATAKPNNVPPAVTLDAEELTQFCRRHEAVRRKISASCRDLFEVKYRDLVRNFDATVERVFEFLELPQQAIPRPTIRRLRNADMRSRIANFALLKCEVPRDVRDHLDAEDLF